MKKRSEERQRCEDLMNGEMEQKDTRVIYVHDCSNDTVFSYNELN
jgi:hypothetical protein